MLLPWSDFIKEHCQDYFLIKIGDELYLLESQSYDDGSMAVRIAEYAFISARQFASWDIGHAVIQMPRFAVIYIKKTEKTPRRTRITIITDLIYFRDAMLRLHQKNELADDELVDLMGFVNTIIVHITDGNENEERLVNVMGGTVIETASEKLISQGKAQMFVELNQEAGIDDAIILKQMKEKLRLSEKEAAAFLKQYGKVKEK